MSEFTNATPRHVKVAINVEVLAELFGVKPEHIVVDAATGGIDLEAIQAAIVAEGAGETAPEFDGCVRVKAEEATAELREMLANLAQGVSSAVGIVQSLGNPEDPFTSWALTSTERRKLAPAVDRLHTAARELQRAATIVEMVKFAEYDAKAL